MEVKITIDGKEIAVAAIGGGKSGLLSTLANALEHEAKRDPISPDRVTALANAMGAVDRMNPFK